MSPVEPGCGFQTDGYLALELAEEYGMYNWVRALLDPSDIVQSPATDKKHISPPPKYDQFPGKPILPPPSSVSKASGKSRSTRSVSPSKIASPAKRNSNSAASPRKRQTKAAKEANIANANAASAFLQSALDNAASTAAEQEQESINGETVKVEVDSAVDVNGETETTYTNVSVEMPAGSPELPLPEDPEKMVEIAKRMVEEARALEGESSRNSRKRKVDEVEPEELDADLPAQPAKKAKVLEEKLKREKVRTRALVGVTATLAIAYVFTIGFGIFATL